MKKNTNIIYKLTICFMFSFMITSCSDDFFDVNTPSGSATLDQLEMNDLLGPAIYHTVLAQYYAERVLGNYTQYFTGQGGTTLGETSLASTWSNTYLYALPSLTKIIEKADDQNSPAFRGIAKVLIAVNLGLATDCYENIPYNEASLGATNLSPTFQSQEEIYAAITQLLTEAVSDLAGENPSGIVPSSSGDIAYRGNMDKWLRAAHTLKARYAMHLTEVDQNTAVQTALASLAEGFTSVDDDLQMSFDERSINPWHSREVLAVNTGNVHDKIGDQLVSYMNGAIYPFENGVVTTDPRLSRYADIEGEDGDPFRGYVSGGEGISSDSLDANTDFADDGYYTSVNSPMVIISYSEAQFLKAEAELLSQGGDAASVGISDAGYEAYINGINANFLKLGVDGSSADYVADGSISVGAENLMLHHIMKEKYIANFLNPETFVDFRRYDFSDEVFKGLALPVNSAESEFPDQWLVRASYPSTEETRNPDNVNANKKTPVQSVWWDK